MVTNCSVCVLMCMQLAMDLVHKDKAYIRGSYQKLSVVRAGLGKSAAVKGIANPAD